MKSKGTTKAAKEEWHEGWPKDDNVPKDKRYYRCLVAGEHEMTLYHFKCEMKMTHEWVMEDGGYLRGEKVLWQPLPPTETK